MRTKKLPEVLITYFDGQLRFYDGFICKIDEITSVRCDCNVHELYGVGYITEIPSAR